MEKNLDEHQTRANEHFGVSSLLNDRSNPCHQPKREVPRIQGMGEEGGGSGRGRGRGIWRGEGEGEGGERDMEREREGEGEDESYDERETCFRFRFLPFILPYPSTAGVRTTCRPVYSKQHSQQHI